MIHRLEVYMVYVWKQDRFKADAQKVGEELERITYRDADTVVKAAKKSKGELHKCFEWDDAKAGNEYRKEQARLVLRMLVTPVDQNGPEGEPQAMIRVYESVRFSDEDGDPEAAMAYIPTHEALADPVLSEQVKQRLYRTIGEAESTARLYGFEGTRTKLREARESLKG